LKKCLGIKVQWTTLRTRTVAAKLRFARKKSVVPFFSFFEPTKICHFRSKKTAILRLRVRLPRNRRAANLTKSGAYATFAFLWRVEMHPTELLASVCLPAVICLRRPGCVQLSVDFSRPPLVVITQQHLTKEGGVAF